MKTIKDLVAIVNLSGKRVLLRADFNVPITDGKITDDFRIISTLPTLDELMKQGLKIGIVAHIESNNEGEESTLRPVWVELQNKLGADRVMWAENLEEMEGKMAILKEGEIVLMENIRQYEGEKKNDPELAQRLAGLADYFVNDAFSVCHRKHASIVGVPEILPSFAGLQLEKEVTNLSQAFNPSRPFGFILGGAKFETKLPLVKKYLDKADWVAIGGALANDVIKAGGGEVGESKVSKTVVDLSGVIGSEKLLPIIDVVVENERGQVKTKKIDAVLPTDKIKDLGAETVRFWGEKIAAAEFVLWNGPIGWFEYSDFSAGTTELAKLLVARRAAGAKVLIGGGDTVSAISELGLLNEYSFISTGGGATLDFLANETLPGIEVIGKRN